MDNKTIKKILKKVETLCYIWEDCEKTVKEAQKIIDKIYMLSHIGVDECENKHEDWREELNV